MKGFQSKIIIFLGPFYLMHFNGATLEIDTHLSFDAFFKKLFLFLEQITKNASRWINYAVNMNIYSKYHYSQGIYIVT